MTTAPVVRCHACNVQTTHVNGQPPEKCPACGGRLEHRPPATIEEVPA